MNGETYELKEPNDDPLQAKLLKKGVVVEFTLGEIINEERQCEKAVKELTAKVDLEKAKMVNIEHHHPFVQTMTMEQLFTAHMYYESRAFVDGLPEKIEVMKKQLAESKVESAKIIEQFGWGVKLPKGTTIETKTKQQIAQEAVDKIIE